MKAKDPKVSDRPIPLTYPVRVVDSVGLTEVRFTTDSNVKYSVSFTPNRAELQRTSFAQNSLTLSFVPTSGYEYAGRFSSAGDPKVKATIMEQLVGLFKNNRFLVLNYSCDLESDLERHRSVTFGKWYKEYLEPIGVLRKQYSNPSDRQYSCVFYWNDNPDREEVERVFSGIFLGK